LGLVEKSEVHAVFAFALGEPDQDRATQGFAHGAAFGFGGRVVLVAEDGVQVHIRPVVGGPGADGTG
jgi:hypothetical protein